MASVPPSRGSFSSRAASTAGAAQWSTLSRAAASSLQDACPAPPPSRTTSHGSSLGFASRRSAATPASVLRRTASAAGSFAASSPAVTWTASGQHASDGAAAADDLAAVLFRASATSTTQLGSAVPKVIPLPTTEFVIPKYQHAYTTMHAARTFFKKNPDWYTRRSASAAELRSIPQAAR
eukprot:TRINITY_DN57947_c0_g1_i1.p1 TRINITY_DN57947_c0_g1~~TRINITY_DN57947_c0_g1_i1.p1  ORF type:complete len:204 (+),score=30.01 TRINITY_DN57947_c0_g1_i1:73-612(+)